MKQLQTVEERDWVVKKHSETQAGVVMMTTMGMVTVS